MVELGPTAGGGAPVTRDLVRKMMATGAHLFTNYGLTEGGAVVSATPPNYDADILCDTVGVPDESTDHKLIRDDGGDAAPGESGEIWLRGEGVFLGYWNNRAATAQAMTEDGWLRTGDVAIARPDGRVKSVSFAGGLLPSVFPMGKQGLTEKARHMWPSPSRTRPRWSP